MHAIVLSLESSFYYLKLLENRSFLILFKSLNAFVYHTILRPQPPHTGRSDDLPPPGPGHEAGVDDGGGQQPRCGPRLGVEAGQAGSGHTGHTGQPLWTFRGQHQASDGGHPRSVICGIVNICDNKIIHPNI